MRSLLLWAAVALAAIAAGGAHARSTKQKQTQPIAPAITSLSDKDAREKARVHPAFSNAGKQAGVEVWRIENFNPVAVSQKDFGRFYKGDSYIILKTTSDNRNNLSWDIHYWIGSESSQDEAGAAAILTVGLDDKFDGKAVQHRETMGYESQQFLNYFSNAIRYVDGGVGSGFKHVTTNAGAEKRLFQVKGKKNIRVRQVDPLISSMNKGDVFILDINQDILVYVGDRAKNVEKLKAISVANQIRDQDHNGRGKVDIIDQYSNDADIQKFFTALGSGAKDLVPEDSAGGDDQSFERSEEQAVTLYEVSDSSGALKATPLSKPYKQEQLKPQETYILDTISGSIYVWVGKQATKQEKTEAMSKAQQFLSAKKYPSWVHVARIPQGTEPAVFKQYFTTWRDAGMTHNRLVRSAESSSPVKSSEGTQARIYSVSPLGDNKFVFDETDFNEKLNANDVYLVNDGSNLYIWVGKNLPNEVYKYVFVIVDAYKVSKDKLSEKLPVLEIRQGFEPKQFKSLFPEWNVNLNPIETEKIELLRTNEIP